VAHCVRLKETLERVAREAIASLHGARLVERALGGRAPGAVRVWAVGKAAAAMAEGAASALGGELDGGLVIAKADARVDARLKFFVAAHPLPDERGVIAARALLDDARARHAGERALLLLSGGTSALLAATVPPATLDTLRAATKALLFGGASIGELNVVRRHLGAALGGRLAAATEAALEVLALSDVVGDDPAAIGSGPASPDPSTVDDALEIARRYRLPAEIGAAIAAAGETPKRDHPAFARVHHRILASPLALAAVAAEAARAHGLVAVERAGLVEGALEDFAAELTAAAERLSAGEALIAVGEPTVRVRGDGLGGRAQHLALAMARALAGRGFAFVACGSDGSDGPTDAAGGAVDGDTWRDAERRGLAPERALARFDAHPLLDAAGAAIRTGSTGTNLTDLYLLARAA